MIGQVWLVCQSPVQCQWTIPVPRSTLQLHPQLILPLLLNKRANAKRFMISRHWIPANWISRVCSFFNIKSFHILIDMTEGQMIQLDNQIDEHWYNWFKILFKKLKIQLNNCRYEGTLDGRSGFFPISYVEVSKRKTMICKMIIFGLPGDCADFIITKLTKPR